jgi:hypothetical protein
MPFAAHVLILRLRSRAGLTDRAVQDGASGIPLAQLDLRLVLIARLNRDVPDDPAVFGLDPK